jgi:hypothetical protein
MQEVFLKTAVIFPIGCKLKNSRNSIFKQGKGNFIQERAGRLFGTMLQRIWALPAPAG